MWILTIWKIAIKELELESNSLLLTNYFQSTIEYERWKICLNILSGFPQNDDVDSKWSRVALCEKPTEPADYYAKPCVDQSSHVDPKFNVSAVTDMEMKTLGEFVS